MQSVPALRDPKGFEEIHANATALAPWLRGEAARIEEARRLPDDVVDALKRATIPKSIIATDPSGWTK